MTLDLLTLFMKNMHELVEWGKLKKPQSFDL